MAGCGMSRRLDRPPPKRHQAHQCSGPFQPFSGARTAGEAHMVVFYQYLSLDVFESRFRMDIMSMV